MKALLMKDLRTLKNERRLWVSIIGVSVLFGVLFQNWYFMMGYIMFGLSMIARTMYQYDVADQGIVYLMTLPITRKEYVKEKYLLSLMSICIGGILSMILTKIGMLFTPDQADSNQEIFSAFLGILAVALVLQAIIFPVELKYDVSKSRIIILLLVMGIIILFTAFDMLIGAILVAFITIFVDAFGGIFIQHFLGTVLLSAVVVGMIYFSSYRKSVKIMGQKEFCSEVF